MINKRAFTLVELAIVMTIIGLLIGGVLKGQELLENARMTSAHSLIKATETAVVTFRDIYKALPGDILNPANVIQNCTAAPCNISGDQNGIIGVISSWGVSDENHNFWVHMARAGLISGINPNSTWTPATWFDATAPVPKFPIGGREQIVYLSNAGWAPPFMSTNGHADKHYFHGLTENTTGGAVLHSNLMKFDLKFDDGRPNTGDIFLHPSYARAADGVSYNPNSSELIPPMIKSGF